MNRYSKLFIIGMISTLMITGCSNEEDTKISTIDDNSKEVLVVNINDNEESEKQSLIKNFYLGEKTEDYDFSDNTFEGEKFIINYPLLVNYKGELTMDYINQTIEAHAEELVSNTSDVADGLKLTYKSEIVSQNDNFISIKFTGELPYEGSSYKLMSTLMIDLNSTDTITSSNLFTEDKTLLMQEFEKAAKLTDTTTFLPANYMIMYIEKDYLVYAYMENDMATDYTEIKIPLKSILDNLKTDFADMPAS